MAEYPPHSCGPCPYLGKFEAISKDQGDFLQKGTVPNPQVKLQSSTKLCEHHLGVNSAFHAPDLSVPPVASSSNLPPATQLGVVGAKHTPYSQSNILQSTSKIQVKDPQKQEQVDQAVANALARQSLHQASNVKLQYTPSKSRSQQIIQQAKCCNPCMPTVPSEQLIKELCPQSPYNLEQTCPESENLAAKKSIIKKPSAIKAEVQSKESKLGNRVTFQEPSKIDDNNNKTLTNMESPSQKCLEELPPYKEHPCQQFQEAQKEQLNDYTSKHKGQEPCPCEKSKMSDQTPPWVTQPHTLAPVPNELRPDITERAPCYLPQPEDKIPVEQIKEMKPIGPWATGRVDWGPLAGLTGTRPVVDKYSIARFSEGDWRKHNKDMLDMATTEQHKANLVEWNGRQCLEQSRADIDKNQEDNTKRLLQRAQDLHRWKCELERAIAAAAEEVSLMEGLRRRLKQASAVLQLPESIAGECLERRTGRLDPELVRDVAEEELIKELALTAEIREQFYRALKDVELQLQEDKTAKQRLEYDWSDKKLAHEIDALNVALNNRSTILLFKPGAVQFSDEQSTEDYWEHFTRETLQEAESTRQRSVALRNSLDSIMLNAARDLRSQADRVELALAKRIACTEEIRIRLENELKKILQRLADVEDTIRDLRQAIRNMDTPMKKAQTRLDNRNQRPRVENCRDSAHFGLIEEVKLIADNVSSLQAQLRQAEDSQASLIKARSDLEREIMVKRKTLEIDRDRTQLIRSYYPSATALTGH